MVKQGEKELPLSDEEIRYVREDKKHHDAWGIVWTSVKRIAAIILGVVAAYWAFWDMFKKIIKQAI
jgi:hypothetical protein